MGGNEDAARQGKRGGVGMSVFEEPFSPLATVVSQRFEAKYRIGELMAQAVRGFIQPFVVPDAYTDENACYTIHSLYLDTPDLALYHSSVAGKRNRFKMRIRYYDSSPDEPVFLEIKRRSDQVILKDRVRVPREVARRLLAGRATVGDLAAACSGRLLNKAFKFRDTMERIGATPRVNVRYVREAYMARHEDAVRITFDRDLACFPAHGCSEPFPQEEGEWRAVGRGAVILEVKFTNAFPRWVHEAVQRFHLVRDSIAKYVICVIRLHNGGVSVAGPDPSRLFL